MKKNNYLKNLLSKNMSKYLSKSKNKRLPKSRTKLPELNAAFLANNLFLTIAAILVLFINSGSTLINSAYSKNNANNLLTNNIFSALLAITAYWVIGYSLMYGGAVIGGILYFGGLFFDPTVTVDMVTDAGLVPSVDFSFQATIAATVAVIASSIVGGKVESISFSAFVLVLTGIIYPILGSWKWNGGWLDERGFTDFAGSSIIHVVGAFAGLAVSLLSNKSNEKKQDNIDFTRVVFGSILKLIGYISLNSGSQLAMDQWVPYLVFNTLLSASAGAIGSAVMSVVTQKKLDISMITRGMEAGLVSITGGVGDLNERGAWFAGFTGSILMTLADNFLKNSKIDDNLGAFSINGICGIWGTLVTGLWGTEVQGDGSGIGLFNGGGIDLLLQQATGVTSHAISSSAISLIVWILINQLKKVNIGL